MFLQVRVVGSHGFQSTDVGTSRKLMGSWVGMQALWVRQHLQDPRPRPPFSLRLPGTPQGAAVCAPNQAPGCLEMLLGRLEIHQGPQAACLPQWLSSRQKHSLRFLSALGNPCEVFLACPRPENEEQPRSRVLALEYSMTITMFLVSSEVSEFRVFLG